MAGPLGRERFGGQRGGRLEKCAHRLLPIRAHNSTDERVVFEVLPEPQPVGARRQSQGTLRQLDSLTDAAGGDDLPPRLNAHHPAGELADEPRNRGQQNDQAGRRDRCNSHPATALSGALVIRTTAGALICRSSSSAAARSSIRSRLVSSSLFAMSVRRTASR